MSKIKTYKTAKKRFKITNKHKFIHKVAGWSHLKAKKTAKIKYRKRVNRVLSKHAKKGLRFRELGLISK